MSWDLKFFDSGEWQVLDERLWELQEKGISINPDRGNLFASFEATPFETCRVAIYGQDPYPNKDFSTGIAFDIPQSQTKFPPTLLTILKEYSEDLGLPFPSSGSLLPWCKQGVLLYNVVPTCFTGYPASHRDWSEWSYLSKEVVEKLSDKGVVHVFLGGISKHYSQYVSLVRNSVLSYSHPSPLSSHKGQNPFLGSRLFSTINIKLRELNHLPINWRLPS